MTKKRLWIVLSAAAVLLLVIVLTAVNSRPKGFEVEVLKTERGEVSPTVTADGLIAAKNAVNISSQVMGEIVSIPFLEGSAVKKGDILVQINPDTYQRDVASALANLQSAEVGARQARVTLAQRKKDWERAEDLFRKGIFSASQRDDARLALDQAELAESSAASAVAQAKAYFQKAQDNLAKTTLRSPMDGVVTAVNAKVGETAVMGTMNFSGTVILTVSDLSEIITEVQVDEADYPRLKLGQPVVVIVDALGGRRYDGKVIEISASARPGASGTQANIRQFLVKVAVTNPDSDLKPGVTARVRLLADKRENVIRVPVGAIRTEEKSGEQVFYVFVSDKQKAAKKIVQTGLSDDLFTEVTEGLEEGDEVVIGPYRILRNLKENDRLRPKVLKPEDFVKSRTAPKTEEPGD
ncbi:MAG: efflux RND transporter periplasmic adaptor subunit [Acidobacteriota bacterium]